MSVVRSAVGFWVRSAAASEMHPVKALAPLLGPSLLLAADSILQLLYISAANPLNDCTHWWLLLCWWRLCLGQLEDDMDWQVVLAVLTCSAGCVSTSIS